MWLWLRLRGDVRFLLDRRLRLLDLRLDLLLDLRLRRRDIGLRGLERLRGRLHVLRRRGERRLRLRLWLRRCRGWLDVLRRWRLDTLEPHSLYPHVLNAHRLHPRHHLHLLRVRLQRRVWLHVCALWEVVLLDYLRGLGG